MIKVPAIKQITIVGKRGTVVIPAALRRQYGLKDGSLLIAEAQAEGILLRQAEAFPIERYSAEQRASFLLANAVDEQDYQRARDEVAALGLDPDQIAHDPPAKGLWEVLWQNRRAGEDSDPSRLFRVAPVNHRSPARSAAWSAALQARAKLKKAR